MTQSQPQITGTTHTLPFHQLSPRDLERLCLWLVQREGFDRAEQLGATGREQGRDVVAWRAGELWAFQCKRVRHFGPTDAEDHRPAALVFLVAYDVSAETRRRARARCARPSRTQRWPCPPLAGEDPKTLSKDPKGFGKPLGSGGLAVPDAQVGG